jgi:DNA-binding NtrC family response regulator
MSDMMKKVLIVDDDVAVTNYFMVFLMQTELFEPEVENDSRRVKKLLKENHYDVIMLDLDMPNITGMEILKMMKAEGIECPVLILTGVSDVDLAVRAMKYGAFDYLTKPVDDEHLLEVLASALEMQAMKQSMDELPAEAAPEDLDHQAAFKNLPTQDSNMHYLFHQAETLAKGNLSVFLWGERGTGKKWLAHAIHKASGRREGPFVALDCTTHPPDEFSGILFGRAKDWQGETDELPGALSDASAGTLFLNNIEHMSPQVQMRLNHALHTGEFYRDNSTEILQSDVRYIVSSTHDLTSSKFHESFSRDLLYQFMVNNLQIPPLRDRPKDIPLVAKFILKEECRRSKKEIKEISPELIDMLQNYYFPGNLQELRKLILSAIASSTTDTLDIDNISTYSRERLTLGTFASTFHPRNLHEVIREQVENTVKYCKGDLKEAASLLDISVKVLNSYRDQS